MRIANVKTKIVSVPFHEEETWHWGKRRGISNILVYIEDEEGRVGIGEAVGFPSAPLIAHVLDEMIPHLIGESAFRVTYLVNKLYQRAGYHYFRYVGNCAIGGIEMALWDLIGQAAGQPVCNLFGGIINEKIPFYYHLPFKALEAMAEDAVKAVARGATTLYFKVGIDNQLDIATVKAVREAVGPGPKIRVDANEAWSIGEAIRMIRQLEPYDIEFVEQPVSMYDIGASTQVQKAVSVAVGANQTSWLEWDVLEIIRQRAADVILTDQHQVGGMYAFKQMYMMAHLAGIPVLKHSFGDLGVSTAAALQVLATCPDLTMASQTHLYFTTTDLLATPFQFDQQGALPVPLGPGLGVQLDEGLVREAHERYLKEGAYSPFESR